MSEIKSYANLYNYLQQISLDEFKDFIQHTNGNIDNYEATFKLFSYMKLFSKFDNFLICNGNYNECKISPNKDITSLLNKPLGGKGDKSDLTLLHNTNNIIIATTCKNRENYGINDLDIRDLSDLYHKNYKVNGYDLRICIVIPDKKYLLHITKNSEKSSEDIKNSILSDTTIIFDYNDLYDAYNMFIYKFKNIDITKIIKIYNTNKDLIKPYLHQKYAITKCSKLLQETDAILLGHLPRSGKTYIMGCIIYENSIIANKGNYLIITTAPTETIPEYIKLFNNKLEFDDFTIITKEDIKDKKSPKLGIKNIIIVSKQYLQSKKDTKKDTEKTRVIKWLKDTIFDMRFIDETHNGGTTELAKTTLDTYGCNSKTIYITATYLKPVNSYNIDSKYHILWDLEDNEICKNITNESCYNRLVYKYGSDMSNIVQEYNMKYIESHYKNIPKLHYISWKLNDDIKNDMINDDYGFSIQSILMLKNDKKQVIQEFADESKVEKLVKTIFGYEYKKSYSYYDKNSFLGRIKNINDKPEYHSRWFSKEKPLVVLAFLPCGIQGMGIADISETLRKFIINKKLLEEFEIVCINSETENKNPNLIIEETEAKAKINGKLGILVLTGKKCSLGITIKNCDIVLLLTNIEQYDTVFQMMYRCMSEDNNKRNGYVIDLNLQRCVNIITIYGIKIGKGLSTKESIKYVLEQKLVEFNVDEWNDTIFGVRNANIDGIISKIYNVFTSKSSNCIDKILENIDFKIDLFTKEDQKLVKSLFEINKNKIKKIKNILENEDIDVPDGIDKIKCDDVNEVNKDIEVKDINDNIDIYNEIIKKLIPLVSLITVSINCNSSLDEMMNVIKDNEELRPIILESIMTWWGNKVEKEIFNVIIMLYNKYFKDNDDFNNKIADIQEIFRHNLGNINDLSKSIDKFLVPHENEKKQNAEISTPYSLRKEMLDKIPEDFWTTPKKVFEPCSGKAGFLIDIIDRFMNGLSYIEDKEERYRVIVEECLYYSDINKTNIFISKLLLNPYGKYKLNYNEGDTLKLNIKEKWGIDGFDAVIGNPPYQPFSNGKKGGKSIWPEFVEYGIDRLLNEGYLVYVHPALWRKPNNAIWNKMIENKFHYISIHNKKEGDKIFKATTRFDWYVLQKTQIEIETTIIEEDKNKYKCVLSTNSFIPNFGNSIFEKVRSKINESGYLNAQRDSLCHTSRGYVSNKKTDEYKYEIINAISKTNGIRYLYSSKKHNYQDNKKVIFSNGEKIQPIYDDGKYGTSEGGIYILVENDEEGIKIVKYLQSKLVSYLIKATKWSNFETTKNVFHNICHPKEIEELTDENIYKYFNLTNDEIYKIENIK